MLQTYQIMRVPLTHFAFTRANPQLSQRDVRSVEEAAGVRIRARSSSLSTLAALFVHSMYPEYFFEWFTVAYKNTSFPIFSVALDIRMSPSLSLYSCNMSFSVIALSLVAVSFARRTPASLLTSTGSTIELGGIPYYVPSRSFASIPYTFYTQALTSIESVGTPWIPVTVVKATSPTFSTTEVQSTLKTYQDTDDVWTTGFLSGPSPKPRVCVLSS